MNWGRIVGRIQTKVWRVFLLFIHCYLYSFALRFKFLQTHATFYVFLQFISYWTLQRKKRGKPDRKPYPLPYGLRNPYRNLKSENSQDYVQRPQRNSTFMNSTSVPLYCMPNPHVIPSMQRLIKKSDGNQSRSRTHFWFHAKKVRLIYVKNWGKLSFCHSCYLK